MRERKKDRAAFHSHSLSKRAAAVKTYAGNNDRGENMQQIDLTLYDFLISTFLLSYAYLLRILIIIYVTFLEMMIFVYSTRIGQKKNFFFSSAYMCVVMLCAFKLNKNSEWGGRVWFFSPSLSFLLSSSSSSYSPTAACCRHRRHRSSLLFFRSLYSQTHKRFFQTSQRLYSHHL